MNNAHPDYFEEILDTFMLNMNNNVWYCVVKKFEHNCSTLKDYIAPETKRVYDFQKAYEYSRQITERLRICHQNKILHRDLKPEQFLLTGDGKNILIDFDWSSVDSIFPEQLVTTEAYQSPEGTDLRRISEKSDIFTVGLIIWELLLNGNFPYSGSDIEAKNGFIEKKKNHEISPKPSEISPALKPLDPIMLSWLDPNPQKRPDAAQLIQDLDKIHDLIMNPKPANLHLYVDNMKYIISGKEKIIPLTREKLKALGGDSYKKIHPDGQVTILNKVNGWYIRSNFQETRKIVSKGKTHLFNPAMTDGKIMDMSESKIKDGLVFKISNITCKICFA
jgi:serine/threonine protein kinase